jgi:site-specific DNA-methyltransferase (adenine-specific)
MNLNQIITSENVEYLKTLPNDCVDLIVTSPPYDDLREYNGYTLNLHILGEQLFRVLKDGGICVMVIQDSTKNFAKSLTSFRTIVDWCDNIGFRLFECNIYSRQGTEGAWWKKRFRVDHEYMPIFLKGNRPQYFDKENLKIPSKHANKIMTGANIRTKNGKTGSRKVKINPTKCPGTVMNFGNTCGGESKLKSQHPAVFPNMLAYDMIECFCPPNGIVLDPFNGSGTTTLAAKCLGRNFIGIDISEEYNTIAKLRLEGEVIERKNKSSDVPLLEPSTEPPNPIESMLY